MAEAVPDNRARSRTASRPIAEASRPNPTEADDLTQLSLAQLWELFPIRLSEPDPAWRLWFEDQAIRLRRLLGQSITRLSHIGSTAVPGLVAKPVVDILLETADRRDPADLIGLLATDGWRLMARSDEPSFRLDLNQGYTTQGYADKVFHLHLVRPGDNAELFFRDWLRDHPETQTAYVRIKRELAARFEHDRDAYTRGKAEFVDAVTAQAHAAYGDRYPAPPSTND